MKYAVSLLVIILSFSCANDKKTEQIDYTEQNEKEIIAYIAENNLTAQRSNSGLYYVINNPGAGEQPTANSTVTVAYKGYFLDKTVFDQSSAEGATFSLQRVIRGWTEGITYFKEGGNGILLVPSHLGYGSSNSNGIPGGSVLVFDVSLLAAN
ncbi:FKBP-type peptidyl-prolyl cis-trans isomerase [Aurantibacter crassamenti]|uniref:FKBP-type peptidyl-prolyl cis-trans isomerase n=1 Tax=Aurantibacter crassamenti TaxID=1837375 RepID=UPI00193A09E5|nr:FKBP-type peptidyl-prolyl cis-trans isomerase [Aurantibacter crassamenti]MBM1105347.1 FKBP-type peptidyl-prolyl cis-trans isomerase [Aurantibacter crassamenti]